MEHNVMTIEEYNKLPKGVIRIGLISNSPTGCFMTRDENIPILRFVVYKQVEGWVVYFGKSMDSITMLLDYGDTSNTEKYIRRAFPCSDEVYKLYVI